MYKPTGIPSIVFAYYKHSFSLQKNVKWWTGVMWIACELINKLFYHRCMDSSFSDGTHLLQRILFSNQVK